MICTTIQETLVNYSQTDPHTVWVMLKMNAGAACIKFSKDKSHSECLLLQVLEKKLHLFENMMPSSIYSADEIATRVQNLQAELEAFWDKKTKSALFCSKANWQIFGERSSSYFMNLEKRRYNNRTIKHLYKSDGDLTSSNKEVLAELDKHFGKLYCLTGDESHLEDLDIDMELVPQVPEECQLFLESLVTMEELNGAIKTMQTGKALGCDGFGLGFYTTF